MNSASPLELQALAGAGEPPVAGAPPVADGYPLLSAQGLRVSFPGRQGQGGRGARVEAVRGVSLQVQPGEVLAVVGESGSGKSTLARALMGMVAADTGTLELAGEPLPAVAAQRSLAQRRRLGMVFQDSAAAFDPRFTVERILREPLQLLGRQQQQQQAGEPASPEALLDTVGLAPSLLGRRPHELSGGQRQRVGIARALAGQPQLLICDEAVSALDVSVQAQILNLLADLQERRGLALIFITHDLAVVSYIADRIAVMHQGELVETGPAHRILDHPAHPYTRQLLDAAT